ncbi:Ig domain-containing protein [Ectobacillus sp. sgz5001026]|uniref:Ig-like domain-containing protein n=1 Tax=Ectobacillus sp. sgz5001026 TaxID=3242473 RepID=UPI0036D32A03
MLKRISVSACLLLLLVGCGYPSQAEINAKFSREFTTAQVTNVIAKSASEIVMKTGSSVDIPYHITPGSVSSSNVGNLTLSTTSVSSLRPFFVTQADMQNAAIGSDLVLLDSAFTEEGSRGLLSYTGMQGDVLDEIRNGYNSSLSVDNLNNIKKIVLPGNSNNYQEVIQAVQDLNSKYGNPTVTIPVMEVFDNKNPNFVGFVKVKLKVDGSQIKGTYAGWVGSDYFSLTQVQFKENFPAGLDVQMPDSRFTKTGTPQSGETVTGPLSDIQFYKNLSGDYDGVNQDFTLTVTATSASPAGSSYQLNQASVKYYDVSNSWKTGNFPSLTITAKDGLQDVTIPGLIERNVVDPSAPIPITVVPASATTQLQLQYSVTADQNFADVSFQNPNIMITPKSPGEMNVTVSVKDDFGDVVQKTAHVMLYQFVSDSSITVNEGETKAFPYTLTPSTISSLKWTMADTNIASVSNSNQITGNHVGQTLLTITGIGSTGTIFTKQVTVTVKSTTIPLQSVYFDPSSTTMKIGDTLNALANLKFVPANATNQKISSWTSSNPDIATVDGNGVVTAKKAGTVSVTAQTATNLQAVLTITVDTPYKGAFDISNPLYRW